MPLVTNCNFTEIIARPTQRRRPAPTPPLQLTTLSLVAIASRTIAISLLLVLCHVLLQPNGSCLIFAQARLIHIYHKSPEQPSASISPTDLGAAHHSASHQNQLAQVASSVLSQLASKAEEEGEESAKEDHRRTATIDFTSSPMQRIIDLIGSRAPVIVLDSTGGSSGSEQHDSQQSLAGATVPGSTSAPAATAQQLASVHQTALNQAYGTPSGQAAAMQQANNHQFGAGQLNSQPQLQTQQQQQHWTIVETSQMLPPQLQQQQQSHQQQLQPTAQQQQLIQTSVPNEQYFTFTPFGLAPTGNPFASVQQQQQQQQQAAASLLGPQNQFNPYMMGQQQMGDQQQQQQQLLQSQVSSGSSEPVQPVFLSSYVPELPASGGGGRPMIDVLTSQMQQQQQVQPNSIQQIQRAQRDGATASSKSKVSAGGESGSDGDSGGSGSEADSNKADEEDEPKTTGRDEQAADDSGEPHDESGEQDSGPRSGSMSYEDKYDSDDPAAGSKSSIADGNESEQHATTRSAPLVASSTRDAASGLMNVGLNDDCLQCICRASSGCDHLLRCITIGAEEKYCGPFKLTEEYWQKAGSPGDSASNFHSFEECANDADCAVETVTNYMKKYYRDCDGDDYVTCADYARLHKLSPGECSNSQKLHKNFAEYWQTFQGCAEGYNRTRNGDDEDI